MQTTLSGQWIGPMLLVALVEKRIYLGPHSVGYSPSFPAQSPKAPDGPCWVGPSPCEICEKKPPVYKHLFSFPRGGSLVCLLCAMPFGVEEIFESWL